MNDLYGEFRVLVLEESEWLCRLFEYWLSPLPVECVRSLDEFRARLDSTVAVACLSESVLGGEAAQVRTEILNRNPYCQLVLLQSRGGFVTIHDDEYDACLQRPLFEAELQSTIEHRLKCGVYSVLLREFYALNARLVWLDRSDTPETKESKPPDGTVDQDTLYERHGCVRERLQRLQADLDEDDVRAVVRSVDLHKQFLTAPTRMEPDSSVSKYHPPRCPDCKLPWGVDHGNDLGSGFDRVAAHVWKCRRCDDIVHGLGESHRRVTSR